MQTSNLNAVIKINRLRAASASVDQLENMLSAVEFDASAADLSRIAATLSEIIRTFGGNTEPPVITISISQADVESGMNRISVLGQSLRKRRSEEQNIEWI